MTTDFRRYLSHLPLRFSLLILVLLVGCSSNADPDLDSDTGTNLDSDAGTNLNSDADADLDIDRNPLVVQVSSGPNEFVTQRSAEFRFLCNRDAGCDFMCSLDDAEFEVCESPALYEELAAGNHIFRVRGTDRYGEESESATWEWTIDDRVPEVVDLTGPAAQTNEEDAVFAFDCNRDDCEFTCELTGVESGEIAGPESCESGIDYNNLPDDDFLFSVFARDSTDAQSDTLTWSWTVDQNAPTLEITSAPPTRSYFPWDIIEFECTNRPDCSFECALDRNDEAGDWSTCVSPSIIDVPEGGEYEFHIRATDPTGNQAQTSHSWNITLLTWASTASGYRHSCAIGSDGSLWCWGANNTGQIAQPYDGASINRPTQVGEDLNWESISGGFEFTCALREDGTLWCWGYNGGGQLGLDEDNDPIDRVFSPHQVGEESDWVSIAAHRASTCGLREDGTLWCWGDDTATNTSSRVPTQVGQDSNWESIGSGGHNHHCGIRDDSTLWCWVADQPGNGDDLNSPLEVSGDAQWSSVSEGESHTCAIKTNRTLWCWGKGPDGQLGTPVQVGPYSDWIYINSGDNYTCGIRDPGTLWCWGSRASGRLGLGSDYSIDTTMPVQVGDLSNWSSVTARYSHTLGIQDDQSLWSWGAGTMGKLGLGDANNRFTPEEVGSPPQW